MIKRITTTSLILAALIFLIGSIPVEATHFRGGSLFWQQAGGNSIKFTINATWRRTFFPGPPVVGSTINVGTFLFGDATSAPLSMVVNAVDAPNNIIYATGILTHTYASSGNYTASWSNCCRISTLQDGNDDQTYRLQTIVNVGAPYNNAPVFNVPPMINLATGQSAATFPIAATDPDGDPLSFRLSTSAESGLPTVAPSGFSLSGTGMISFNTVGKAVGNLYAVQVMAEDGTTKSANDFIIRIVGPSAPPTFVSPTPAENSLFTVTAGMGSVNFTIKAQDSDVSDAVTLVAVALPIGASMTPTLPVTGPVGGSVMSNFSWSPATSDVGTYPLTFIAADNVGVQSFRNITIKVLCPLSVTWTAGNVSCTGGSNGSVDVTVMNATPPVSYSWSGPNSFSASTEDISGLPAGTYTLDIIDAKACKASLSVTIEEPASLPTCEIDVSPSPTVPGQAEETIYLGYGPQSVTVAATGMGGTPPYSFTWDNGLGSGASHTVSPTSTTTYTATITDANGCTSMCDVTINVVDVRCGNNGDKVVVCHNGNTICISANAVPAHLANHGDLLGDCPPSKWSGNGVSLLPQELILEQNFPNPFNPTTQIQFGLPADGKVRLRIFEVNGKEVETLVDGFRQAGVHTVLFDASSLTSGTYLYRLEADGQVVTRTMTLTK